MSQYKFVGTPRPVNEQIIKDLIENWPTLENFFSVHTVDYTRLAFVSPDQLEFVIFTVNGTSFHCKYDINTGALAVRQGDSTSATRVKS